MSLFFQVQDQNGSPYSVGDLVNVRCVVNANSAQGAGGLVTLSLEMPGVVGQLAATFAVSPSQVAVSSLLRQATRLVSEQGCNLQRYFLWLFFRIILRYIFGLYLNHPNSTYSIDTTCSPLSVHLPQIDGVKAQINRRYVRFSLNKTHYIAVHGTAFMPNDDPDAKMGKMIFYKLNGHRASTARPKQILSRASAN